MKILKNDFCRRIIFEALSKYILQKTSSSNAKIKFKRTLKKIHDEIDGISVDFMMKKVRIFLCQKTMESKKY